MQPTLLTIDKIEFGTWMYGQTSGVMYGEAVIYSWDWERWYNLKTKSTPTFWD